MALFASTVLYAQADDESAKLRITGELEWFGIAAQRGDAWVARDRLERLQLRAETGKWRAVGTWLCQTLFSDQALNESYVVYSDRDWMARYGRIMPTIGQSNWEDQWYSGFVMLPFIETMRFDGYWIPALPVLGADVTFKAFGGSLALSALSSDNQKNRVSPSSFDRYAMRYERSVGLFALGLSLYGDRSSLGKDASIECFDFRYCVPHWIVRGEAIAARTQTSVTNGFFIDGYYRPAGWSDATLVTRYQNMASNVAIERQGWTLGAKVRLPYDLAIDVNYAFGPDLSTRYVGGGWEIGLRRTFSF